MKLTLEHIRILLREKFGHESFIASFISSIEASSSIPTACINREGEMLYNPEFMEKHVKTREDMFCIIVHEMMHPMFGHFVHGYGMLENLAADMVINACISRVYSKSSGEGSLFKSFYKAEGIEGLLRPDSNMQRSRYSRLYASFYGRDCDTSLSTASTICALKVLCPVEHVRGVVLLGGHTLKTSEEKFSKETEEGFSTDLGYVLEKYGEKTSGYASHLHRMLVEVLRQKRSIKQRCLGQYATKRKVDHFLMPEVERRHSVSPVPIRPSKRELLLLGADIMPLHYRNTYSHAKDKPLGLGVYLDVSGSVHEHLPEIIGLLMPLKNTLRSVYLFSNRVVEVPFATVLKGELESTYGTDFDCIAESILKNNLDKAVIFTDGYAGMQDEMREELLKKKVKTLCILYGGKEECKEFELLGEVMQLEDVVG